MKPGWLKVARAVLYAMGLVRAQTQRTCPNPTCPLKMNKTDTETVIKKPKLTQDEMIKRQQEMYKKNHPHGH